MSNKALSAINLFRITVRLKNNIDMIIANGIKMNTICVLHTYLIIFSENYIGSSFAMLAVHKKHLFF